MERPICASLALERRLSEGLPMSGRSLTALNTGWVVRLSARIRIIRFLSDIGVNEPVIRRQTAVMPTGSQQRDSPLCGFHDGVKALLIAKGQELIA